MIDAEFADVAIAGKDLGLILSFYIMFFYKASYEGERNNANLLLKAIEELCK